MIYQTIILKLSGEILGSKASKSSISPEQLEHYTTEIADIHQEGIGMGVVIGGGNIWRGKESSTLHMPEEMGDYMGLLATVMNGIALYSTLKRKNIPVILMNRMGVLPVGENYSPAKAQHYIAENKVVILAGGTGKPGCTTDSAAALAAVELKVDACIKGTKVDGVYSKDPHKFQDAIFYHSITLQEAIDKQLAVMDLLSLQMCIENGVKIQVYNATKPKELYKLLAGQKVGTLLKPSLKK